MSNWLIHYLRSVPNRKERRKFKRLQSSYENVSVSESTRLENKGYKLSYSVPLDDLIVYGRALEIKELYNETHVVFYHSQCRTHSLVSDFLAKLISKTNEISNIHPHMTQNDLFFPLRLVCLMNFFTYLFIYLFIYCNIVIIFIFIFLNYYLLFFNYLF